MKRPFESLEIIRGHFLFVKWTSLSYINDVKTISQFNGGCRKKHTILILIVEYQDNGVLFIFVKLS